MQVYHLEPNNGDTSDPSWEASSLIEGCWIEADTEELARRQVEQATFQPPKLDKDDVLSPWTQEKLVVCRLDQTRKDVPSGQVLSESGKIIDLPAVSTSL
jgi:hypothetical protein